MLGRAMASALISTALCLAGATAAEAQEALEVNGVFVGESMPKGWGPNKPGYWDEAGAVVLTGVPDIEKTAVRLTSVSRAMYIYNTKPFAVHEGDKVVVKCLMRGEGAGSIGLYYYPGGGWLKKEFKVTAEWSEFTAELSIPDVPQKIVEIRIVIGIPPRSSTEFLDLTADLTRAGQ